MIEKLKIEEGILRKGERLSSPPHPATQRRNSPNPNPDQKQRRIQTSELVRPRPTEIKADADGIEEYSGGRGLLERRITDCEVRLKKNHATIAMYGESIGPLEEQYVGLLTDATTRFEDAKRFYDKAIQMLIDKFDYNPAFKRPGDQL